MYKQLFSVTHHLRNKSYNFTHLFVLSTSRLVYYGVYFPFRHNLGPLEYPQLQRMFWTISSPVQFSTTSLQKSLKCQIYFHVKILFKWKNDQITCIYKAMNNITDLLEVHETWSHNERFMPMYFRSLDRNIQMKKVSLVSSLPLRPAPPRAHQIPYHLHTSDERSVCVYPFAFYSNQTEGKTAIILMS